MPTGAAKLREMLASGRTIISPGVYDGLGARVCLQNGFDTLYMVRVIEGAKGAKGARRAGLIQALLDCGGRVSQREKATES